MGNKRLNLGCGNDYKKGWVNVDYFGDKINKKVDLNKFNKKGQYSSFKKSNEYDEILCSHLIEHLDDPIKAINEIIRIAKNRSKVTIKVPHFSCSNAYAVTHKHVFNVSMLEDWTGQKKYKESEAKGKIKLESTRLRWMFNNNCLCRFIDALANISPRLTERLWCYWVGGFQEIEFKFRVIK